jgi:hypothetical protein
MGRARARVLPGAERMVNDLGDREQDITNLEVTCRDCQRVYRVAALPWSPIISKTECPYCEYVNEVQVRESVMDPIEDSCAEGAYERELEKRSTNSRVVTNTPWGKATLIN